MNNISSNSKKKKKFQRYNPPDETLLRKAEDDLKNTFKFYSTPMHLESMAEVLYYMATDSNKHVKQGSEGEGKLLQTLTMCAKAAACQDGEKRAPVHKVRGQSLCALGEHQAALRSFQRAVECETTSNIFIGSGALLVSEYEHVLMVTTDVLPSNSPVLADMVYWLHKVAQIFLSTDWVMYQITKLKDQVPDHWKGFVKYCEENDYMRELHDIQRAAMWENQPRRYHLFSRKDGPVPTVSDQYQLSSDALDATTSKGDNPHASVEKDKEEIPSGDYNPHARVEEDMADTGNNLHDAVESVFASLSADDLGDDGVASDFKQITYIGVMNRKSGKTRHFDITPSFQGWTTDNVSSKPIRPAPETSKNRHLTYDFFVIYSDNASEWVFRRLLEELEETGLKGCVKDREFKLGKVELTNYLESIENSVCTIIVITKDFETNSVCTRGMHHALLNQLVIPLLLHDNTDIPKPLKCQTFFDATDTVDWVRLQSNIEREIIKLDVI